MMQSFLPSYSPSKWAKTALVIGVLVFLIVLPILTENRYYLTVVIMVLFGITLSSLLFPLLRMGLLFVAQAAFLAMGAYTSTLLVMKFDINSWAAMFISGALAAVVAVIIGFPTLRIRGLYFLLVTLGLNQVVRIGLSNWRIQIQEGKWVGGADGIFNIPNPDPIPIPGGYIDFTVMANYYYLMLILAIIFVVFFYRLWSSHLGRLLRAVNSSEDLAQGVGVNLFRYKLLMFVLSCAAAGIMGSFHAHYYGIVVPTQFGIWQSFNPLIQAIVGGIASPIGAIIGPALLIAPSEAFRFLREYKNLVYAGTLIVVMLVFPTGLLGLFQWLGTWLAGGIRRKNNRIEEVPHPEQRR